MTELAGPTPFPGRLVRVLDAIADVTGRAVAWLTLAMVLAAIAVVALRYGFGVGLIWLQESVTWMHAAVFMLGAAWTLRQDGHVRVDIFYRRMSPRRQALVDLAGTVFLLLPTCAYLLFESLPYVASSWRVLERSREAGGMPALYLLKTVIPVMAGLLILQGLAEALRAWGRLRGREA
ncbi:MAG: TRAP transporter small permease subunit [Steroidobacteraceae bacterium]|jgi:TRAP-type mannitol/chloroaromatic compound transport system permease small subunit|nr:TRAP transporter small permease subunit [Steroidobacteraceae bacterium]